MSEVVAYSTAAVTLGLVAARPRIGIAFRITPAMAALAGVSFMSAAGIVRAEHLAAAAANLWSPFVAIASIMVMTEVARRAGVLEWWASLIETRAPSTSRLFLLVFALGVVNAAAFNNDAAILLLTPVVVSLAQRRYPGRPEMVLPFAFAVLMSAGVAALPVSNPMNMVVASFLGIPLGEYIRHMLPLAVAGWFIAFLVLKQIFRSQLASPINPAIATTQAPSRMQRVMMWLLVGVFVSYPLFGLLGGAVWVVATSGALLSLVLAARHMRAEPVELVRAGVSWETLAFLAAVLVMSLGLRDVGLVNRLIALYEQAGIFTIGGVTAIGSALLNNHPMSYLNMMALQNTAGATNLEVFAALVGGDLGPRLLPMGSLAGLLWIEMLRREGVEISVARFVAVGTLVTAPTIAVSLAILSLY